MRDVEDIRVLSNNATRVSRRDLLALAVSLAACFAAAGLGSLATAPRIPNWYADLDKPAWTPPGWVFGPVWSVLYLMMAVAAWLVWRNSAGRERRLPLGLFAVQLVLNCLWSFLFFGLQNPLAALIEIGLLWAAILATAVAFRPRSRLAAMLLVPYLAWVSFAAVLNFAIWRLNA